MRQSTDDGYLILSKLILHYRRGELEADVIHLTSRIIKLTNKI